MSIKKLVLRSCRLLVPVLGALYGAGCGGSAFSGDAGGAGSGAGGTAGTSASGGDAGKCSGACPAIACGPGSISVTKPGACCPTCIPDGSGGTGSVAGSTGVGGCGNIACTGIACAPGWVYVTNPGDCCPTCVPGGQGGAGGSSATGGAGGALCAGPTTCPGLDCVQGYKLELKPGDCCPSCVPNPDACKMGQAGYDALRQKLLQQPDVGLCKVDSDCTFLSGNAYCGDQCSAVPISVASAPSINDQLSSWASNNCSTCTPIYPPCAAPLPPVCSNTQCVAHGSGG